MGCEMSINAINGMNRLQFCAGPSDPIKPETRQRMKELGIDENSVRTETQAQNKIKTREEQIKHEMREHFQAQASSQIQTAQAGSQVQQPQQIQAPDKTEKVDGIKESQQIQQPKGIEQQNAIHNQEQGDEQAKAFSGSHAKQALGEIPFLKGTELVAMYNKFKLGLI